MTESHIPRPPLPADQPNMENLQINTMKEKKPVQKNAELQKLFFLRRRGRKDGKCESAGSNNSSIAALAMKRGSSYSLFEFPEAMNSLPAVDSYSPLARIMNLLEISKESRILINSLNSTVFQEANEWYTDIGSGEFVTAASLKQLLLYLTNPDLPNVDFQKSFLISFQSFCTPHVVMGALFTRYFCNIKITPNCNIKDDISLQVVRARIVGILRLWFNLAKYQIDEKMMLALDIFASVLSGDLKMKTQAQIFMSAYRKLITSATANIVKSPESIKEAAKAESSKKKKKLVLTDYKAKDIAEQFTIIHAEYFLQITPKDLLNLIWKTKTNKEITGLSKLTEQFDKLSRNISLSVITGDGNKERAARFFKWVDVGAQFLNMNNFHGLFAVVCGLTHPSVSRMEMMANILKHQNREKMTLLNEFEKICNSANNFKNYRDLIPHIKDAAIPFIGAFQKDLIYVQESYPNEINGLINYRKAVACVAPIQTIQQLQYNTFKIAIDDNIHQMIKRLPKTVETNELMKLSMFAEKKMRKTTK